MSRVQTHRIGKLQKALTDSDFNISDDQLLAIVNDFAVRERARASERETEKQRDRRGE